MDIEKGYNHYTQMAYESVFGLSSQESGVYVEYTSIEFSAHAIQRMFERQINADTIVKALREGEIIAEYKDDIPYPSFLLLHIHEGKPLHVVQG